MRLHWRQRTAPITNFKSDILKGLVSYSTDKNFAANLVTITGRRAFEVINMNRNGAKPDSLLEETPVAESKRSIDLLEQESLTRFDKSKKNKKKKKNGAQLPATNRPPMPKGESKTPLPLKTRREENPRNPRARHETSRRVNPGTDSPKVKPGTSPRAKTGNLPPLPAENASRVTTPSDATTTATVRRKRATRDRRDKRPRHPRMPVPTQTTIPNETLLQTVHTIILPAAGGTAVGSRLSCTPGVPCLPESAD